jgi:protein TonB
MRLGGLTHPARLIRQVTPIYPEAAIKLRLRGSVRFKGRITKDGTLVNITLLSGHPVLVPAATEAVRLFRYQPAALNGVPVEEDAEAKVDFILP